MGKATEMSIDLAAAEDNILPGDNAPAEVDNQFAGGTLEIGTTEILPDVSIKILGTQKEPITGVTGLNTQDAYWVNNDDNQVAPYLGFGGILKKMINGQIKWVAVILRKTKFTTPGITATTQGTGQIEWNTPTLSATIMRADDATHGWRKISSLLDTEADAKLLLNSYLGITDTPPETSGEPVAAVAGAGKAASK